MEKHQAAGHKGTLKIMRVERETDTIVVVCHSGLRLRFLMEDPGFAAAALLVARRP